MNRQSFPIQQIGKQLSIISIIPTRNEDYEIDGYEIEVLKGQLSSLGEDKVCLIDELNDFEYAYYDEIVKVVEGHYFFSLKGANCV